MLTYCQKNKKNISCVVVADLSRLARNVVDQGQTIASLKRLGIRLVSIDEPIIDDTSAGKLAANLLASFNQFFSDSLSEKTKDRMKAGVKAGRWLWVAPLGYKNHIGTKTVIIDQERAPLVRKVFELMAEGVSFGDAMRQVTALGLTTRKSRRIPSQTFSRLIRNPFYCGWIEKNGDRIRGNHEPLISEDVFNAVQQRLSPSVPHLIERDDFPLRGFVRCYKCGKNLTSGQSHGRKKKYARYWCWTRGCGAVGIGSEELEFRFFSLLCVIQPQAYLLARLPSIAARSWSDRKERIAADSKALTRLLV
jgi:site-specific DNA recombinase